MEAALHKIAVDRYNQEEFLATLLELALAEKWSDLQHLVQHDMAKAVIADYCYELGTDYLDNKIFYAHWEEVIELGWQIFCQHTGISREHIRIKLSQLHEGI